MATIATHFSKLETVATESSDRAASILSLLYQEHVAVFWTVSAPFVLSAKMREVRRGLVEVNQLIAPLVVETDEDRSWYRDKARKFSDLSRKIDDVRERSPESEFYFFFRQWADDAACLSEDVAETLALAASPEFTRLLEENLEAADATPKAGQDLVSSFSLISAGSLSDGRGGVSMLRNAVGANRRGSDQ